MDLQGGRVGRLDPRHVVAVSGAEIRNALDRVEDRGQRRRELRREETLEGRLDVGSREDPSRLEEDAAPQVKREERPGRVDLPTLGELGDEASPFAEADEPLAPGANEDRVRHRL